MKKNSFFTFIFSFVPGAGHMYLGLMKKGTSIMTLFSGIIFIGGFFGLEFMFFMLPVIWFYSFFDAINYNNMPIERKALIEDKIFLEELLTKNEYRSLLGGIFIFLGIYMIYRNFIRKYFYTSFLINTAPTIAISVIIILLGISLIKNNRIKSIEEVEDLRKKKYTDSDKKFN